MKRILSLLLIICMLASFEVTVSLAEESERVYVDVTELQGITAGGWYDETKSAYHFSTMPTANLIDDDDSTKAGFHHIRGACTGYMYVDLGMEYKIHHIEVVAYDANRPANCAEYNLIVTNTLPDTIPYNESDPGTDLLIATPEYDANATSLENGKRTFDVPKTDEEYRYVSFEQFKEDGRSAEGAGLVIQEVNIFVDEADMPKVPVYVDVTDSFGVTTGGATTTNGAYDLSILTTDRLIDGKEEDGTAASFHNCGAGFYFNVHTGYMYIDLRREYKIHHIEVVAYDAQRPKNCAEYNLIVTNTLPDLTPYDAENPGTDMLVATPDTNPNATTLKNGKRIFELPETDERYRYVSFEQFTDRGDRFGLVIQEVRVYVDEEDVVYGDDDILFEMTDVSFSINEGSLNIDYTLFNGSMEHVIFAVVAYDKSGEFKGTFFYENELDTYVNKENRSSEIDISSLPSGEDISYSFAVFDKPDNLKVLLYAEDILSPDRKVIQPLKEPLSVLEFDVQQKGKNADIEGTAPGTPIVALMLKPARDINALTVENADEYIAYLGSSASKDTSGKFKFDIAMPDGDANGTYTVVLALTSEDISLEDRTRTFEYASMAKAFESVTADSFLSLAEKYKDSYEELYIAIDEAKETIGNSFMIAKEAFANGTFNDSVKELSTADNIITIMKASVFADKTINSTEFSSDISGVADTMPLVFNDKYVDADEFETLVNKYKTEVKAITTGADLAEAYGRAAGLSAILGGTREDIIWAMTNFPDALGIDLDAIVDSGVSLNDIAKEISNTSDSVDGYLRDGMDSIVTAALGELTKGKDDDDDDSDRTSSKVSKKGSTGTYPSVSTAIPGVTAPQQHETAVAYSDMQGYEWAADAVAVLTQEEIVNGVGDGSFAPWRSVTREEAAKLIVLTFGFDSTLKTNDFSDCIIDTWYYPFVTAASANGIVKGVDRKTFGVGSSITRQDMAVMIDRAFMVKGIGSPSGSQSFADSDAIADYAVDSVMRLSSMGVVTGLDDGRFAPHKTVTRAEAAAMLYRALELLK